MSGYQEVLIQIRSHHMQALQKIAQNEFGDQNAIEKVIFTALLDYFESSTTNQLLEEALREGLGVLEEHVKVLLDLIKTLLISSSYDTTKIRVLLEFLFENDIGKEMVSELYKRTGDSVIERLKEEKLENVAQIITENESLRRQLRDLEDQGSSLEAQKQQELSRQQQRDREYQETVKRLTQKVTDSEQSQKATIQWVNGLLRYLSEHPGQDAQSLIQDYMSRHPKPVGII